MIPSAKAKLIPTFPARQADILIDTFFYVGGLINGMYVDQGPATNVAVGNTVVGYDSFRDSVKATVDFYLGDPPVLIAAITSGGENTLVGHEAGRDMRWASDCTFVGARAGRDNTDAYYNCGVGHYALGKNILGWKNTSVGTFSMMGADGLSNPNNCSAFGFRALNAARTNQYCVAVGEDSQLLSQSGIRNASIGKVACSSCQSN